VVVLVAVLVAVVVVVAVIVYGAVLSTGVFDRFHRGVRATALVTSADVAALEPHPGKPRCVSEGGQAGELLPDSNCIWRSGSFGDHLNVTVEVARSEWVTSGASTVADFLRVNRGQATAPTSQPGIGDEAFCSPGPVEGVFGCDFRLGNALVELELNADGAENRPTSAKVVALTHKVAGRLAALAA
jgi:hypothetical protein